MNKEEGIQNYVLRDYRLFPLSRNRVPLINEWQKIPFSPMIDKRCFTENFGISLQADDLILDIDPRNFKENDKPHLRLCKIFPEIKQTLIVQTGSGGLHLYLKKPANFKTKKHHSDYQGVDFLSKGAFAVGAGSIHPKTKKEYKIVKGSFDNIVSAPTKLLEMLKSPVVSKGKGIEFVDDKHTFQRFIDWLSTAPVACSGEGGNETTFKVACRGRAFGLSTNMTDLAMMMYWNSKCQPPWEQEKLSTIVQNAFKYNEEGVGKLHPKNDFEIILEPSEEEEPEFSWHRTKKDKGDFKINSIHNICNFFNGYEHTKELQGLLKFNLLSYNIEFTRKPFWINKHEILTAWDDNDALAVMKFLSTRLAFNTNKNLIHDAALAIAQDKKYHPIIDYLESLKWDGTERVKSWMTTYLKTNDSAYESAVGELMLIAAIKRIYQAGCKFKNIIVIEGDQQIGKSPVCEILGGKWYADLTLNVNSPDTIDAMRNKWIIEVSEMECTRRAETQALKAFLSRQVDVVRLAYARASKEFPRHNIFIGTINPDNSGGYLKDMSGNTRYLPVLVPSGRMIDVKGLANDRDQLWAEALQIYKENTEVELYLKDSNLIKMAEKETLGRRVVDPWTERVAEWLNNPTGATENIEPKIFVRADEVFTHAMGGDIKDLGRDKFIRIANVMQDLGWGKSNIKVEGGKNFKRSVRGYFRPDKELVELL